MDSMPSSCDGLSRRELLQNTYRVATSSLLAGAAVPYVHAGQDSTVQIALVGCGGRGTGAAHNALATQGGPTKLVAMADVFDDKLRSSHDNLSRQHPQQVDVPHERQFLGFEAYKQAMDCLRPGDVVILATPPAFRWLMFAYAIERGLNVFMEKPTTVDGPSTRKMLALAEEASRKNLKVGVGLMCRHCAARQELHERIKNGEIGDITLLRAYRAAGPTGHADVKPKPPGISDLHYQIRHFHGFLWLSGGAFSDFLIHNIDECCWMKDAWPIEAKGFGGRHYRGDSIDQNFDVYSVEYTFADGTKLYLYGRTMPGCHSEFASYAHGTKGSAVISTASHTPARCRIYQGHKMSSEHLTWRYPPQEPNPYQLEWDHLMEAIRRDLPYNEAKRGAEASLVTAMGRMSCHTGQVVTWDEMLNCDHDFAPNLAELKMDGPPPLLPDEQGKYPVPMPGLKKTREY